MWNFQRIICIWICCVSCMFGTTQLSSLVAAVPYEYFDDHDQSFYDLDTEQIQAKYDTRLLSQQMLKPHEQQTQQKQKKQQQHQFQQLQPTYDNQKGFTASWPESGREMHSGASFVLDNSKRNDMAGSSNILTKLKSNDANRNNNNYNKNKEDNNNWLDETTAAITEKQEIHLPRAASCYTNGQKYTHGQKVPRLDNCEVCLCMDGEIFCWWEKCAKKLTNMKPTYDDYSTPYEESSTMKIQSTIKSTVRTTLKPMKKPKINRDYKYGDDNEEADDNHDDDIGENDDDDDEVAGDAVDVYDEDIKKQTKLPYKTNNKHIAQKKFHGEHQEEIKLKEKQQQQKKRQQKEKQMKKPQEQQQHQQQKQHTSNSEHYYHHPTDDRHVSSGSSKILNFPENLPSVLYYDYKTEEHHQHQHQHREQHLKHQHEKELKHRQHIVSRHHEYGEVGQEFNTAMTATMTASATATAAMRSEAGGGGDASVVPLQRQQEPPLSAKYLAAGNDNIYNVDLQTDSDILPEPPTKKTKLPAIAMATGASNDAGMPTTISTSPAVASGTPTTAITAGPLKKQMFSPWDYGKPNRDKVNSKQRQQQQHQTHRRTENDEDAIEEDQDDAFHRWLTSTEKNNKNGGDYAALNDYNLDDKNYENIDIDIDATLPVQVTTTTTTTKLSVTTPTLGQGGQAVGALENSRIPKYEINFSDNNQDENISPFSNPYQNNKNNNRAELETGGKSQTNSDSDSGGGTQSSSTEDNASVVNIDIMLTASADIAQQQQQQQQTDIKDSPQQRQLSLGHGEQIPSQAGVKQNQLLISNTNGNDNEPLSLTNNNSNSNSNINPNTNTTATVTTSSSSSSSSTSSTSDNDTLQQQILGGALLSSSTNSSSINTPTTGSNSSASNSYSNSDSYKLSQSLVSNSSEPQSGDSAASSLSQATPTASTTLSPERQCNVMGTLYKIGDVLPQDTGNCLQCICIDGSTMDDTPRVTCSPHNCPPLVLPDLFDATGY